MRFPVIDYVRHPAFAPYAHPSRVDDGLILGHVVAIDGVFSSVRDEPGKYVEMLPDVVESIRARTVEINKHALAAGVPILAREWLGAACEWAVFDMHYELARVIAAARSGPGRDLEASEDAQLRELRSAGTYRVALDPADYAKIRDLALARREKVKARLEQNPEERAVESPSRLSPLGRAIDRALSNAGVLRVLSAYKCNPMRVLGTGLEFSRPQQTWYPGIYSDAGLTDSSLQYLHVDESDHVPKAMIYATPVGVGNGPTGFIPGSNTWDRSEFLFRAHKGLDRVTIARYGSYVAGGVYRATVRDAELRRIFMQMPAAFRGSSHLGDDILDGTPLSEELCRRERFFTPEGRAEVLVFDGARTLHRGGLVSSGERLAMQVAFMNTSDSRLRAAISGGGRLSRLVSRVKRIARAATGG